MMKSLSALAQSGPFDPPQVAQVMCSLRSAGQRRIVLPSGVELRFQLWSIWLCGSTVNTGPTPATDNKSALRQPSDEMLIVNP